MKEHIFKQNRIIDHVRRTGLSNRRALASSLRISNSRVCEFVDRMIDDELLLEDRPRPERRGRAGVALRINGSHGHAAGFDIEARRMRLVVLDFAGRTAWQCDEPLETPLNRPALVERILGFVDNSLAEARRRFDAILGVGLAACGLVDARRGVILNYSLIPAMRDLPLRELVAARTGLPCAMEQNMRALTLAEWMGGAAQHLHSFICVAVRSGVGAGVVIDGRLHTGAHGFAGEVGYSAVTTPAGALRTLHDCVSEQALLDDRLSNNAGLSESRARRAGAILGAQLASMTCLIDPQAIVLAGSLVQPGGPLWDHVGAAFRRAVIPEQGERVQLLPARLGPFAAAIGAAHHCLRVLHPPHPALRT